MLMGKLERVVYDLLLRANTYYTLEIKYQFGPIILKDSLPV